MSRVIAGTAGGRRLVIPSGRTTRPTSDRAREGLFAAVGSELGSLDGLRVADLYSGSGAIGLEAASRGAAHVLLVESDRAALRAIRRNIAELGLPRVQVAAQRVGQVVRQRPSAPYDLVVADPPYATTDREVATVLENLRGNGWLADGALIVVERSSREAAPWPPGYVSDRARRYGEATLWYGHASEP